MLQRCPGLTVSQYCVNESVTFRYLSLNLRIVGGKENQFEEPLMKNGREEMKSLSIFLSNGVTVNLSEEKKIHICFPFKY